MGPLLREPLRIWSVDVGALAPAQVVLTGHFDLSKFINGSVRGSVFCDAAAGTLEIIQERIVGGASLIFSVPFDPLQPSFSFPFIVALFWPIVSFRYTNGGAPATTLEANVTATPVN